MADETTLTLARASDARSGSVIARLTARRAVRSGIGWGLVFGLYVATQALTYASSYGSPAARRLLVREFGSNPGISALVGPAVQIGTVPGFTAWKCAMFLAITGAVWGILTSTKLMRAEEDAGRWELLLVGRTTRRSASVQALAGLAGGVAAFFVVEAAITIATGHSAKVGIDVGGALFLTLAIVSGAAMFVAIGALASQLSSTRRQAAGYASALLGASYAVRMVADAGTGLTWLRWASPLGWIEDLNPLTKPNPLALVPIVALVAVATFLTIFAAGRRDLGASVLPDHSTSRARLGLLRDHVRLAVRLTRPTMLAWTASIIAYGLLLGSIAKSGGKIITSSPSMRLVFARLGVSGAEAYLGFSLLIMAMTLSFVAAGQVSAVRAEESSGRLEYLLVRPLSRTRWLGWRAALAALALLLGGVLAGLATWVGAAAEHAGVGFTMMISAGVNVVPPAFLLLGVGVLAYGALPRFAVTTTYALFVWSFLIEITGGIVKVNHWLLDTSVFHQMAAAPSVPIDWTTNAVMVALGVACTVAGLSAFSRRDLKGE